MSKRLYNLLDFVLGFIFYFSLIWLILFLPLLSPDDTFSSYISLRGIPELPYVAIFLAIVYLFFAIVRVLVYRYYKQLPLFFKK